MPFTEANWSPKKNVSVPTVDAAATLNIPSTNINTKSYRDSSNAFHIGNEEPQTISGHIYHVSAEKIQTALVTVKTTDLDETPMNKRNIF